MRQRRNTGAAHGVNGPRTTGGWHVDGRLAADYASGAITEPDAWSLEKHIEACSGCAALVSEAVRAGAAGPLLAELRGQLLTTATDQGRARRRRPLAARAATGRRRPARARPLLRAFGPGPHRSWAGALLLVVAGALGLAYGGASGSALPLLLLAAPLVPLLGVALSYGRHSDPMHEIAASTPSGGLRLLLTRTAAVLAVSLPLLTATGAVLPSGYGGPGAAAWLLPGLALTSGALALSSYIGCRTAAAAVAAGWLGAVAAPVLAARPESAAERLAPYLDGPAVQGGWAAAALLCAALLTARRSSFAHLERV
ncbi:zf-HC2 domain-containing protein [Streptomyces sp. NPDC005805]|uniref:zf-HC2 domain-containing protein n=1 Tax=Streptomyces sp. NPDC005805 TaxID=3157068 RepID=UPI0033C8FE9E